MSDKLSPPLAKRLAAYSATAGVALAAAAGATAQVVYHDFDPDLVVEAVPSPMALDLDFDDDGVVDFRLSACDSSQGCDGVSGRRTGVPRAGRYYSHYDVALRVPDGGHPLNGVLGYGFRLHLTSTGCASRLGTGGVVGPVGTGQGFYPLGFAAYSDYWYGPYCPFLGQEGYAGFRFVAGDGQLHYGWIRLAASDNADTGTAFEYGYAAAPETPVLAGIVSDAVLTGTVDQTAFPPAGGLLRYTFTVENVTGEPLPLDLWLDADGAGAHTRRLGSGTLPPHTRVTRTVALPVPAGAPAGLYDVRFKVGDFASGQFLTFQRFAVTKEATAASPAGGEAGLFAASPAPGDLFAAAGGAGHPGTNVLGVPSPNPARGGATLTLSVAEAQHVVVSVHDALGRRVAVLHDGPLAPGAEHRLVFDGSHLPSGVYAVRAAGEAFSDARVLTLAR